MNTHSKIYVTGHSGMVGKTLLDYLKSQGYKNIITISSKELDLRDQRAVSEFFTEEKPEYVFHLAARVGGIMANIENPAAFLYDNLMINTNVINSAYESKVKKLLFFGSSCIYPREAKQPMREEYLLDGKFESTNEGYAVSKLAGLKLCEYYNKQYGTDFITIVPPNLYGDNENYDEKNSHVLISLLYKFNKAKQEDLNEIILWGTGIARREFMHVKDAARACEFFMQNVSVNDLNNQFINVGTGEDVSIKELAELISKKLKYEGKIKWDSTKPDGMPKKLMDNSRMKKLGFKPEIELNAGIELFIKYLFDSRT